MKLEGLEVVYKEVYGPFLQWKYALMPIIRGRDDFSAGIDR